MLKTMLDILVIGGDGQIGLELAATSWPEQVRLHIPRKSELDLCNVTSIASVFARTDFSAVVNCGAYTAVDKAETDLANAFAANAIGPAALADATRNAGIPLIQVSTDYVFDGSKAGFYVEDDRVSPLNVYGASKLAGEMAVRLGNPRSVVLRTAWVLSPHRSNFAKTMLRLAMDRDAIGVVGDQMGSPTSARDIANVLKDITLRMIADENSPVGIYHFVNAGEASWADLARTIFLESAKIGGPAAHVNSISVSDYLTAAQRPANSRLSVDKISRYYGVVPRHWQPAVADIVGELIAHRAFQ